MRLRNLLRLHLLLLIAVVGTSRADVGDHWNAGLLAWDQADYRGALDHFRAARDAGLDTPAVYYNIAVTQYQLGLHAEAADSFERIARRFPQMRALAEYNLGLTAVKRGYPDAARRHFVEAHAAAADDRTLRILASRRLRELEYGPEPRTAWSGAVGVRAGYDSNVALRDEEGLPAGISTDSPMFEVFGTLQSPRSATRGFGGNAGLYVVRYPDAGDFDQAEARLAGGYEWQSAAWRWFVAAEVAAGRLASEAFDRRLGLHASASRPVGQFGVAAFAVHYDDIEAADETWAGVSGHRWIADGRYSVTRGRHRIRLHYRHEANHRADPGVSPSRDRWNADYRFGASNGFSYELGVEYRSSRYVELEDDRKEVLTTVRGAVSYAISEPWLLLLELRSADNDSTDPVFEYGRNVLSLGAFRLF
jgi:tetratricopeptide (TPR) repeat protein